MSQKNCIFEWVHSHFGHQAYFQQIVLLCLFHIWKRHSRTICYKYAWCPKCECTHSNIIFFCICMLTQETKITNQQSWAISYHKLCQLRKRGKLSLKAAHKEFGRQKKNLQAVKIIWQAENRRQKMEFGSQKENLGGRLRIRELQKEELQY